MKIIGIVAEYNPFHMGHKYQIEKAKQYYNDSNVVVVMSGNYVQRGDMAIIDKYTRANIAVKNGADLVIELPFPFACQNAELFASAAIKELIKVNASAISFGCENTDVNILKQIATIQLNNTDEYNSKIKKYISEGCSYPTAINKSVSEMLKNSNILTPNNTLAIEYIKACISNNFHPIYIPVKRHKANHNDLSLENDFASATAIRNAIMLNNIDNLNNVIPDDTYNILKEYCFGGQQFNSLDNYLSFIYYKIISLGNKNLKNIYDVNEGIENRIADSVYKYNNLNEFILAVKSKRYTYARIRRILLNILLDIKKDDISKLKDYHNNYIKILSFNDRGKNILRNAKHNGTAIITKYSDYNRNGIHAENDLYFSMTSKSSDIYYLNHNDRSKYINNEYTNNASYIQI